MGVAFAATGRPQTLTLRDAPAPLTMTAWGDDVVQLRFASPDGAAARSWSVVPHRPWPGAPWTARRDDGVATATGTHLAVLADDVGRVAVRDVTTGMVIFDHPGPRETRRATLAADPDARYFAFGERTGLLDKRGHRYTCWTTDRYLDHSVRVDELYLAVPFMFVLHPDGAAHGLFLNNTYRSAFDLRRVGQGTIAVEIDGGDLDLFVVRGPEPSAVVERFTRLTGRMRMPPTWALGYHQARWGYSSADEIRTVARELRARLLPADAIHIDIDHMDELRVFTWNPNTYPRPASLMADLRGDGFHAVVYVDVGVKYQPEGGYAVFDEGVAKDCFLQSGSGVDGDLLTAYVWPGLCAYPDFARASVREWWGRWHRTLVDVGVRGVVEDMNEPAMHDRPVDDPAERSVHPPLSICHGDHHERATHAEVHNVYGHLAARAADEQLRRDYPDERMFVMSRAGFAGIQRHAAVWTGDNASHWEHLEMSLPQLLNLGLSGVAFAGADIGGFFDACQPELLVRWMQLGAFYPFARNNAAKGTPSQEPWAFGAGVEAACRAALELRYRLLPYLVTLCREACCTGAPILRPMFFHDRGDPATHEINDQAMFGSALLIAPVVRPGKVMREVYLPAGRWYDFHRGTCVDGPRHVLASARLDEPLPLYARGGSIVPVGPPRQWTGERPTDPLTLEVFPDSNGDAAGTLYEDDGITHEYETGASATSTFVLRACEDGYEIRAARTGSYRPPPRRVVVRVHGAHSVGEVVVDDAGHWHARVREGRGT